MLREQPRCLLRDRLSASCSKLHRPRVHHAKDETHSGVVHIEFFETKRAARGADDPGHGTRSEGYWPLQEQQT